MSRDIVMTPERRKVCYSAAGIPHGVGHNAVCVCNCRWCREERDAAPEQGELFAGAA